MYSVSDFFVKEVNNMPIKAIALQDILAQTEQTQPDRADILKSVWEGVKEAPKEAPSLIDRHWLPLTAGIVRTGWRCHQRFKRSKTVEGQLLTLAGQASVDVLTYTPGAPQLARSCFGLLASVKMVEESLPLRDKLGELKGLFSCHPGLEEDAQEAVAEGSSKGFLTRWGDTGKEAWGLLKDIAGHLFRLSMYSMDMLEALSPNQDTTHRALTDLYVNVNDLFETFLSDESKLVQYFQDNEAWVNEMLAQKGTGWTAKHLVGVLWLVKAAQEAKQVAEEAERLAAQAVTHTVHTVAAGHADLGGDHGGHFHLVQEDSIMDLGADVLPSDPQPSSVDDDPVFTADVSTDCTDLARAVVADQQGMTLDEMEGREAGAKVFMAKMAEVEKERKKMELKQKVRTVLFALKLRQEILSAKKAPPVTPPPSTDFDDDYPRLW